MNSIEETMKQLGVNKKKVTELDEAFKPSNISESDKKSAKGVKDVLDKVSELVSGDSSSIEVEEIMDYTEDDIVSLVNELSDASKQISKLIKNFR